MTVGNGEEPQRPDPNLLGPETPSLDANNRQTRNVTVTIQYAVLNGGRQNGTGGENNETVSRVPFVLNFTDVPSSATQERLEQVVALASNLAINRLHHRFNRPNGISREAFEKLPVLSLDKVPQETCSICYDEFVEEVQPEEIDAEKAKKRSLETEDGGAEPGIAKRQRTEEETSSDPSHPTQSSEQTSAQNGGPTDTDAKDSSPVTYKHSPVQLPCGHIFGRECIREWTQEHNTCPVCRRPIVDADGLNSPRANEDEDSFLDQQTLERIRLLLYGPIAAGTSEAVSSGGNANRPSDTPAFAPEAAGMNLGSRADALSTLANFVVFRPNRGPAANNTETNSNAAQPPAPSSASHVANENATSPLILNGARPGGVSFMPITFIHLRGRSLSGEQNGAATANNDASRTSDTNISQGTASDSTSSGPQQITTDNSPETNSFIASLNHVFNLHTSEALGAATRSGSSPSSNGNAVGVADSGNNGDDNGSAEAQVAASQPDTQPETSNGQTENTERRRGFNLNSLLGLARNFSNFNSRRTAPEQMFNTGVASRRTADGISTVNFTGAMPVPEAQSQDHDPPAHDQPEEPEVQPTVPEAEDS
ncbi:LAME_0G07514g1_1 [Lachancea meyersii CBS 8951]|uniref:LAME_0G07514g1_1 n=1 Tax=Lachancea meyersii CBS 8951 TaxID=1266667 RepID=A0A1G4K7X7_9SACH|nr:LAME_0G07514g1_1 [Lachancea meyersii CBS 8951]